MAGYSGTPLAQKLGIKPGSSLLVLHGPKNYTQLVSPLPEKVRLLKQVDKSVGLIHLFCTEQSDLKQLSHLKTLIFPTGALWVSWPKKSSNIPTDLNENIIRETALKIGLVDVKVCAVDETWSGLKLVWRLKDRK